MDRRAAHETCPRRSWRTLARGPGCAPQRARIHRCRGHDVRRRIAATRVGREGGRVWRACSRYCPSGPQNCTLAAKPNGCQKNEKNAASILRRRSLGRSRSPVLQPRAWQANYMQGAHLIHKERRLLRIPWQPRRCNHGRCGNLSVRGQGRTAQHNIEYALGLVMHVRVQSPLSVDTPTPTSPERVLIVVDCNDRREHAKVSQDQIWMA